MRSLVLFPLLFLSFSLSLFSVPVSSTKLNIHFKINPESESLALNIDTALHGSLPNDIINFHTLHQPHITLYLSDFGDNANAVVTALQALAPEISSVKAHLLSGYDVNGTYAFWNVQNTQKLQLIADKVVNATSKFVAPNQPIPAWVEALPEPLRSTKISYIQKYGSPNVFDQFHPHVTILFDAIDSHDSVVAAVNALPKYQSKPRLNLLGVGSVGDAGTVLRGKDLATVELKKKKKGHENGANGKGNGKGNGRGYPRKAPKIKRNK